MNEKQHALAAEIRAEMAAQRIPATEMQRRAGIKHASWRNWFVTASRPVPYPELEAVCHELGVKLSVLLARAEARQAALEQPAETLSEHITRQLSPTTQEAVRQTHESVTKRASQGQPNG